MEDQLPHSTNQIDQEVNKNLGLILGQVDNSTIITINPPASGLKSSLIKKESPPLLPYLVNRNKQQDVLSKAIQQQTKISSCSLVCIIHGDEFQSHETFLKLLQKFSLPQLMGLELDKNTIRKHQLEWYSELKNLNDLPDYLSRKLAESILKRNSASLSEINEALNKSASPVIVHTHLMTDNWREQGFQILPKLLEFWQEFHQKTIVNQKLIICICIKYRIKISLPKSIFGFFRQFIKQHQYRRTNKQIREYITKKLTSDLKKFDCLSVVILPELEAIGRQDVENWARITDVEEFVGEENINKLINQISDIFAQWEAKTSSEQIPMSNLAEELNRLLNNLSKEN